MKQAWKRVLSFAFVLIMVLSLAAPSFAAGAVQPVTGAVKAMMSEKKGGIVYVTIAKGESDFTINRSDIKVSKGSSGAKLVYFYKNNESYESGWTPYQAYDKIWLEDNSNYSDSEYYYQVGLSVTKAGTAKITYKLNGENHTINLKVLNYVNPVKSVKLKGYKGGANFASATASQRYVALQQKASIKDAVLTITAKSGWKLTNLSISDARTGSSQGVSFNGSKGVSSLSIDYGKMTKGHHYSISANFVNAKTGISTWVSYNLL